MILLYIDDDSDDVEVFCEIMKQVDPSCTCLVAGNGKDGLDLLSTFKPDIVFLDVNMPVMNGRDTLRHIKENKDTRGVPVCMLSTYISDEDRALYWQMGAMECLTKPQSFEEFRRMLQRIFSDYTRLQIPPPCSRGGVGGDQVRG